MWVALVVVTYFALWGLFLALARRAASTRTVLATIQPPCVHHFASIATGIACPCRAFATWDVVGVAERIVKEAWADGRA